MMMKKAMLGVMIGCLLATSLAVGQGQFWSTGYIKSWTLDVGTRESGYGVGNMHKDSIDFSAMTHLIMFAVSIRADGTIGFGNLSPLRRGPFNDYVHAKGKPIILSLGGAGNTAFATAIGAAVRSTTVRNLMALKRGERYDGFDIDIEPVSSSDTANIRLFVKELYDSLQREQAYYDISKKPILTAAIYNSASLWARINQYFDQINLMTYDFFGTWFGKSWHNNAPFGAPGDVDIYNVVMTTVESKMNVYLNAGIPRSKLGVGVDMNGYIWRGGVDQATGNGIVAPRMRWSTAPTKVSYNETEYFNLRKNYIDTVMTRHPEFYHFDEVCMVPYLGLDYAGSANDIYITYSDTATMRTITEVALQNNIGGIIIWDVGSGYLGPDVFPASQYPNLVRDPLLRSIKYALSGEQLPTPSAVSLLDPATGTPNLTRTPTFRWTSGVNATSYLLQVSRNTQFTNLALSITITDTSYTAPALQASTLHYWRVQARNAFGSSSWSPAWSFTTAALPLISGTVFLDANSNGSKGASESLLPGWKVILSGASSDTIVTDAGGDFAFSDVPLGSYTLRLEQQVLWTQTTPASTSGYSVTLTGSSPTFSGNFGVNTPNSEPSSFSRYWNTISLPVNPGTPVGIALYPTSISGFFIFDQDYLLVDSLIQGAGYWVKFDEAQTIWVAGQHVSADTVDVVEGWNLIGMVSDPVITTLPTGASAITTIPPGIIASDFYYYRTRNILADTLQPGYGYWVNASQAGKIVLSGPGATPPVTGPAVPPDRPVAAATLTIQSASGVEERLEFYTGVVSADLARSFKLPPAPPSGAFDVRMVPGSEGMRATVIGSSETQHTIPVIAQGLEYPVRLTWSSAGLDRIGASIEIGGTLRAVGNGETMVINGGSGTPEDQISLNLHLDPATSGATPDRFALLQNYPNPFNPSTNIVFTLSEPGDVQLNVYDVLGQRVASLLSGRLESGSHSAVFDGSKMASGVYYYQLTLRGVSGQTMTSTQKMLLSK
jgi:chitinase